MLHWLHVLRLPFDAVLAALLTAYVAARPEEASLCGVWWEDARYREMPDPSVVAAVCALVVDAASVLAAFTVPAAFVLAALALISAPRPEAKSLGGVGLEGVRCREKAAAVLFYSALDGAEGLLCRRQKGCGFPLLQ